jgi:acetyl/propionyl-CoA carboxylase alpha subunit
MVAAERLGTLIMADRLTLRYADRDHLVEVLDDSTLVVDGEKVIVSSAADGMIRVSGAFGGPAWIAVSGSDRWVYHDGCVYVLEAQREGRRRTAGRQGSLAAPMPATVRQIRVAVGDAVKRGETLIVLEAMKMELPVRAGTDGVVARIDCSEGELVQPGRPLVEITSFGDA